MQPYSFTLGKRKAQKMLEEETYLSPHQVKDESVNELCPLWHSDELFFCGVYEALKEYAVSKETNN